MVVFRGVRVVVASGRPGRVRPAVVVAMVRAAVNVFSRSAGDDVVVEGEVQRHQELLEHEASQSEPSEECATHLLPFPSHGVHGDPARAARERALA